MGLTWREQDQIWAALHVGAVVEFIYNNESGTGEVVKGDPSGVYTVQVSWRTHHISKYGISSGGYKKLIINGKKYV